MKDDYRLIEPEQRKPLILLAVTAPISMTFLKGQMSFLRQSGFDVAVICSPGWINTEGVRYFPIKMEREIAVFKDLYSLFKIIKLLHKLSPDIVNAGTPKAGLLVGIAAYLNSVPVRIYTCHGLRLETLKGIKRVILMATEHISAFCCHKVVCVSESLKRKFIELELGEQEKVQVIGAGSCNGIDVSRFSQAPTEIYKQIGIPSDSIVIGFVGRFTRDKGIYEMIAAFDKLSIKHPNLYLLLVGDYEEGDPVSLELREKIREESHIVVTGFIADVSSYYSIMKMLLLPTYREGFPTVVLEAAAAGKPTIAFSATGCVDAVVDGETGLLLPIGDSVALANSIDKLLSDEGLALSLGQRAQERIESEFRQEVVWENMTNFYKTLWKNWIQYQTKRGVYDKVGYAMKRIVDFGCSLSFIILLLPVFLILGVLIKSNLGSPVIFRQRRPGLKGKPFYIYKFRTMTNAFDNSGRLLPDEKRLTSLGKLLRNLSLDELPQLFNVIKGELSLVGPRPLLMEYLPRYSTEQARRHDVKPGITGWAQVHGRNSLSWEEKFRLDVWYVDNWTFWLDIRILLMTMLKVAQKEGINQSGYVTMSEFKGDQK